MLVLARARAIANVLPGQAARAQVTVPVSRGDDEGEPTISIPIDRRAMIAAAAADQRVGIRIDYDRGDGVMETWPDCDLPIEIITQESADQYVDEMRFQLAGSEYSPFRLRLTQALTRVQLFITYGSPGAEFLTMVFDGYIVSATAGTMPPVVNVTALDVGCKFAQRRLKTYHVPANSGRTRLSILIEMLTLAEIPIGAIDIGGDGGTPAKEVTPGNAFILDFIRDFLTPCGASIHFQLGRFTARRYDPSRPVSHVITAADLCRPGSLSAPSPLDPNVVTVAAVKYSPAESVGDRTVNSESISVASYAPKTAAFEQAGDIVTPLAMPSVERVQEVGRVVTSATYRGSVETLLDETRHAFYATLAAGYTFRPVPLSDPAEYETVPTPGVSRFIYEDGSVRAEQAERYRRVSRRIKSKNLDAAGRVIGAREAQYFFQMYRKALWLSDGSSTPVFQGVADVNDDGQAVVVPVETMGLLINDTGNMLEGGVAAMTPLMMPNVLIETVITIDSAGYVSDEVTTEKSHGIGQPKLRAIAGSWGYGTDAGEWTSRRAAVYAGAAEAYGHIKVTRIHHRVLDEAHYETSTVIEETGEDPKIEYSGILNGTPPLPESIQSGQATQEIRATITDDARASLAGEVDDPEHNEYVETREEARVVVLVKARKLSAIRLVHDMPIEGRLHKYSEIMVDLPGSYVDGKRFTVTSVQREFARYRQRFTAEHYDQRLS